MNDSTQSPEVKREPVRAVSSALEIFAKRITTPATLAGVHQVLGNGGTVKITITARKNAAGFITLHYDCASKFQHDGLTFAHLQ